MAVTSVPTSTQPYTHAPSPVERVGGLTREQKADAGMLWEKLRQVPDRADITQGTRDMVQAWDRYAGGDPILRQALPKADLDAQVGRFEKQYLGMLREAIADPGISKITLLQHIRGFIEAVTGTEHYSPSTLRWNEFIALASKQLDHSGKALARCVKI